MADVKPVILIVDDEMSIRESFSLILSKEFKVLTAASGEAALKRVIDEKIDLVYLDIRMPGMNGMETLKRIKEIDPKIEVIMVTAVNDVGNAASSIKLGAKDYIVKPFEVDNILAKTRSFAIKAQARAVKPPRGEELIGTSRQILNIKKTVEQLIHTDASVLIAGEKGLEAEQIAAIISSESGKPLITMNASSGLNNSVLFGREKGSFTSEFGKEAGMLEKANGGILFIRNIELLPKEAQAKLGRALIKKEISREGSLSATPANIRVIAETSANLKQLAGEGKFDSELLDVISAAVLELPPLRTRESDLPSLISHYADKISAKYDRKIKISAEAVEILSSYPWPGNLAELSNTIESIVLSLGSGEISPEDLPLDILIKSPTGGRPYTTLENIEGKLERSHIMNVYRKAGESKERASAMLGIQQKTLESKLGSMNL